MLTEQDALVEHLVAIVRRVTDGRVPMDVDTTAADSVRRLGLDSLAMLEFLVGIEDAFGFEWDDDVPAHALASFVSIAEYLRSGGVTC